MMKFVPTASVHRGHSSDDRAEPGLAFDLRGIIATLRRRWIWLVLPVVIFVGLAVAYALTRSPTYTAVASLVVDTRRHSVVDTSGNVADPITNISLIESELETLRSPRIADLVVRALRLDEDEEFSGGGGSRLGAIQDAAFSLIGYEPAPEAVDVESGRNEVISALMRRTAARRVGSSFVMEVEAKSSDPRKAALIANQLVNSYLEDQRGYRSESVNREVGWLEARLQTLREQLDRAEREVREFKVANNIIDVDGRLLVDQQLADVSDQLAEARSDLAQSAARLERVQQIAVSGRIDESVSEILANQIISDLRRQQNDMLRRAEEWTARYGADHPTAVRLRSELDSLQRAIREEVGRIAQSSRSDYEIARVRVASLERSLAEHTDSAARVRDAQVELRGLEGSVASYRDAYEGVLERLLEAWNLQASPVSDARIVTVASPPTRKSGPGGSMLVLVAAFAGGFAGFALALGREALDGRLKSTRQLEDVAGVRCIGTLPALSERRLLPWLRSKLGRRKAAPNLGEGKFRLPKTGIASYAINNAYSPFAETVRALKVAVDFRSGSRAKVVGITSTFAGEGKTSVSANFAGLLAQSGNRVLLIDADLRNPDLTRTLARDSKNGLDAVLRQSAKLADVIQVETDTGLHFVPGTRANWTPQMSEQFLSDSFAQVLVDAEDHYDYIILDLPPFGLIVDAHAIARVLSDVVLVAAWGETQVDALTKALRNAPMVQEKLSASILNKADLSKLMAFDPDAGSYYKSPYWSARTDA
jgi:polysaccharide biosynthesis transport protein